MLQLTSCFFSDQTLGLGLQIAKFLELNELYEIYDRKKIPAIYFCSSILVVLFLCSVLI